jgi:hypothetical protein
MVREGDVSPRTTGILTSVEAVAGSDVAIFTLVFSLSVS